MAVDPEVTEVGRRRARLKTVKRVWRRFRLNSEIKAIRKRTGVRSQQKKEILVIKHSIELKEGARPVATVR